MNKDYDRVIGQNVRSARMYRRMSQETLSARLQVNGCDITRSALAKIEVGQRHLYSDEILQIKEVLDVSFERLFYGEGY